jgi:signal transduction histidine kinase
MNASEEPSIALRPTIHLDSNADGWDADGDESSAAELARQRAISERLLLAALHEREAATTSRRATFLACAGRELVMSLDDAGVLEVIRQRTLLREGSWCIVDVVESNGTARRLPVAHPDPAKQRAAERLAERWFPVVPEVAADPDGVPNVGAFTTESPPAVRDLGFRYLIVVPLLARAKVLGTMTFVAENGDVPFSTADVALASDLADLCAIALDNARRYRQARELSESARIESRAKSIFLANVSHELITPLNSIGGYVTLIEMGLRGPVSAEQLHDLARIRHNQAHLCTLISDILTFVRSETGRLEYRFSEVSAAVILAEVAEMLQGAAEERQLELVCEGVDSTAVMWADLDRVRQILVNLVMNALKYSAAAGGKVLLSASTTSRAVAIHVADNGPGIPADKLDAIFDPFVQLVEAAGNRRGGVGLGLAISRDLARAMNGDLTVESRVGEARAAPDDPVPRSTEGSGSTFTLTLPSSDGR